MAKWHLVPPVAVLRPGDPADRFPVPSAATTSADGLVAVGGDLEPERLLAAYRRGIFPWYEEGQPIMWWSPDPRAVLVPGELHVTRSLRKTLRHRGYTVSIDMDFASVIAGCALTREAQGTWITDAMRTAYVRLHELGHAHSVETWRESELVGGLYGVAIGRIFFGESMFSTSTDASKVALVQLAQTLQRRGVELIDCQLATSHLASLGSRMMDRTDFLGNVARLTAQPDSREPWRQRASSTQPLAGSRHPAGTLRD